MGRMTFYGTVIGNGSKSVSRGGSKDSGLITEAASWNGRIVTRIWYDEDREQERFRVEIKPHWSQSGPNTLLAEGVLDNDITDSFVVPAIFA